MALVVQRFDIYLVNLDPSPKKASPAVTIIPKKCYLTICD
jgi:hypothetical protein